MARDFQISGPCLVLVKGRVDSLIPSITELGLAPDAITVTPVFRHEDIVVDAWGQAPPDIQFMLAWVNISMTLVHYDKEVMQEITRLSMAGAPAEGQLQQAGQRMGNNQPRFAGKVVSNLPDTGLNAGNNFIGLNLTSPVENLPWRFLYTYLAEPPLSLPMGTRRTYAGLNWRGIPYTQDPYNGGAGAYGALLWDHVLDN